MNKGKVKKGGGGGGALKQVGAGSSPWEHQQKANVARWGGEGVK